MIKKLLFNRLIPNIYKFYLSINLKTSQLTIEENSKCLCIAPHADDESIGMGGTLYKYNKNFKVVCLTNGIKGIKSLPPEEAKQKRKEEFESALKKADINDFQVLDIDDKSIITQYEKFEKLDISDFDYIFIPNILDQHVDHKSVAINLNRLLKEKAHKKDLKILLYEVWSALPMPNAYVGISDCVEKKKEMINSHSSQVEVKDYTSKAISLNSYRGLPHNIEYAEAFMMLDIPTFKNLCKIFD